MKASPDQDQLWSIKFFTAAPQREPDGQLTVPTVAIVDANGKSLVFVRSANTYDPVFVLLGAVTGDRTAVLEGVSADEKVVVSGALLKLYAESQKKRSCPLVSLHKPAPPQWLLPGGVGVAVLVTLALVLDIRNRGSRSKQRADRTPRCVDQAS